MHAHVGKHAHTPPPCFSIWLTKTTTHPCWKMRGFCYACIPETNAQKCNTLRASIMKECISAVWDHGCRSMNDWTENICSACSCGNSHAQTYTHTHTRIVHMAGKERSHLKWKFGLTNSGRVIERINETSAPLGVCESRKKQRLCVCVSVCVLYVWTCLLPHIEHLCIHVLTRTCMSITLYTVCLCVCVCVCVAGWSCPFGL